VTSLRKPYLLFLGDITDPDDAKTAFGLRDWCREDCAGQLRLGRDVVDTGLPDYTPIEAARAGARSLVIGVAPMGGAIPPQWVPSLVAALEAGLDLVSGMHVRLTSMDALVKAAERHGRALHDVRHTRRPYSLANGLKRPGQRLLTVGTDSALGKKYTALALTRELQRRGIAADFRGTGQTGILISGDGIAVDAVVADFIAGAAEALSPANDPQHWDVIEGQGSVLHPAFAGVSVGLLHGSQPDAFVVCYDPLRTIMSGMPGVPMPRIEDIVALTIQLGRATNPRIRCVGVSLNTSKLAAGERTAVLAEHETRLGVPAFDPMIAGVERVVDRLLD
jgi:uncharacterized NAD-dependent epimerase/dehydratase family protein